MDYPIHGEGSALQRAADVKNLVNANFSSVCKRPQCNFFFWNREVLLTERMEERKIMYLSRECFETWLNALKTKFVFKQSFLKWLKCEKLKTAKQKDG